MEEGVAGPFVWDAEWWEQRRSHFPQDYSVMQFRFVKVAAPVFYPFTEPQGGCKTIVRKVCMVLLGTSNAQSWHRPAAKCEIPT